MQTCLATNQVAGSCVNTDFSLDKITLESRHTRVLRHLLQKNVCLGPVKRAIRSATTFRNLQQLDLLQERFECGW